jgi:predicted transcriptional regulator
LSSIIVKKIKIKHFLTTYAQMPYGYGMKFQTYIKRKRQELGITQKTLAKIMGVCQWDISKYESGKVMPSGRVLWKFLDSLNLIKK